METGLEYLFVAGDDDDDDAKGAEVGSLARVDSTS
jgi:hypothetical protein